MSTAILSSVDWSRHGPQNIDVDPAHRTEAIAALNCEAAAHGAAIAILPTPWAHTVSILQPFPLELQRNGGKMDRNSGNDDRRTEARRQVTPKGEIIVEVPFTEAQARALLTLDLGFGCTREVADTVAGAGALLKASLDYAVARSKHNDECYLDLPYDVAHKRRQGE